MTARRWLWLLSVLVLLTVAAGCRGRSADRPDVPFTPIPLEAAPAELREYYAATRALPGFVVLQKGGQTYLLLMAGPAPEPDTAVEVLNIRTTGNEWRVLAVMHPGQAKGTTYPFTVVKLKAPLDTRFKARLTRPDGDVMELNAMSVTDR